MDNWEGEGAEL